jgi:hypothetical protein
MNPATNHNRQRIPDIKTLFPRFRISQSRLRHISHHLTSPREHNGTDFTASNFDVPYREHIPHWYG